MRRRNVRISSNIKSLLGPVLIANQRKFVMNLTVKTAWPLCTAVWRPAPSTTSKVGRNDGQVTLPSDRMISTNLHGHLFLVIVHGLTFKPEHQDRRIRVQRHASFFFHRHSAVGIARIDQHVMQERCHVLVPDVFGRTPHRMSATNASAEAG